MIKGLKYATFLALVFTSYLGFAQSIISNPITGTNPNTANPYNAGQTHDPNITVSGIGRGPGINGVNANDTYRANGWSILGDADDFFYFTLTPNPCYKINFSSFVFKIQSSILVGPNVLNVRSSLDDYSENILTTSPTLTLGAETTITIDLSANTYKNITTSITFRIYGWGALGGTLSINDFAFNGTVSANTTTWSGSAWSNGLPNLATHAIIAGNYNTSTGGNQTSFRACSLTVNAGSSLNIGNNTYIEVENNIVANGNITIQTYGNFKHNSDASTVSGTGTTSVIKQTALKHAWYYYTYWSSPVSGQTISGAFPNTDSNRRFWFDAANYLDEDGNDWVISPGSSVMTPGAGYVATSSRLGPYPSTDMATFIGPFNTGSISTDIVYNSANIKGSWNLIGNPYPSTIDFNAFYAENSSVIGGAAYFWSQSLPPLSSNPGNQVLNFDQDDYAIYAAGSGGGVAGASGIIPTQYIPTAQGFFVAGLNNGEAIFNNAMRMADVTSNSQFFRNLNSKNNNIPNKLWINLTSDNGVFNQILIAYVDGGTNEDDGLAFDAPRLLTPRISAALYSIIENSTKKFAIQGKAKNSLNINETINIGLKTNINASTIFTLSIEQLQGEFLINKTIYLQDNLLNIVHKLSESDYSFTSEVGEFDDRFVVMFNDPSVVTNNLTENTNILHIIDLHYDQVKFTALNNLKIKKVSIFDLLGRELYRFKGESSEEVYTIKKLNNSIYIAKVELSNGAMITKKTLKK